LGVGGGEQQRVPVAMDQRKHFVFPKAHFGERARLLPVVARYCARSEQMLPTVNEDFRMEVGKAP
jgi:hypothetical protein